MARQTTGQRGTADSATGDETASGRLDSADELWREVRIDPVEIALPKGVGYTLRAYRPVTDVTPTDVSGREEEAFPDRTRTVHVDEETDFELDDLDEAEEDDEDELDEDELADEEDEEDDEDAEEAVAAEPEEIPVFLGHAGRVYLFRSAEGLAEFVRSGTENDLSQLDTWADLVDRITADDVVPLAEDTYELDLVVDNLRGGRETWDANLVIQAGEVARDLAYALRVEPVIAALAPGSPLDDLDEAMRATEGGGLGGFLARRKLKKIGAEAAPLGWRTIIGKISSVVDWRD